MNITIFCEARLSAEFISAGQQPRASVIFSFPLRAISEPDLMLGLIGSGNPSFGKITPKNISRTSLEKSAALIIYTLTLHLFNRVI